MDNRHGRWQDLVWLGVSEDEQEGYTGCSKTGHDPDINQLHSDLPHVSPGDQGCIVLRNVSLKPTSTWRQHPKAGSISIMHILLMAAMQNMYDVICDITIQHSS
jgi:hypothetical protein